MSLFYFALYVSALFSYLICAVAANTCSQANALGVNIQSSSSIEYLTEQNNYWSTGCGALKPSCILYPSTADEVAVIVQVLNDNNETFAIKSGGHNANGGFASVQGGPLISTKELNEVVFDNASMTVRVGPGNRWKDVLGALQNTGVTVVGGRMGDVGVGGVVLGGGLSFLSAEYGWAANNVVEFEVVLANASIVTASATSHPDLYKALKGGGNNYGIVTAYTMIAHPIGQIWGGNLIFTKDKTPQMLAAVRDFTANYTDEKAGIIMTAELSTFGAIDMWIMFLFYDGPTPPLGVFDVFTSIGPLINDCKTRSYHDLLTYNDFAVVHGSIYTQTTETFPLPSAENAAEVMGAIYDNWRNTTQNIFGVAGIQGSIAFQPIPKRMASKAREMGGDVIDLDDSVDRIMLDFNYSYWFAIDDNTVDNATQQLYQGTRDLVTGFQQSGKLPEAYLPLFMNDCYFRQDYFARLQTAEFARGVRDEYDPEGFFRDRTKGWKL